MLVVEANKQKQARKKQSSHFCLGMRTAHDTRRLMRYYNWLRAYGWFIQLNQSMAALCYAHSHSHAHTERDSCRRNVDSFILHRFRAPLPFISALMPDSCNRCFSYITQSWTANTEQPSKEEEAEQQKYDDSSTFILDLCHAQILMAVHFDSSHTHTHTQPSNPPGLSISAEYG